MVWRASRKRLVSFRDQQSITDKQSAESDVPLGATPVDDMPASNVVMITIP